MRHIERARERQTDTEREREREMMMMMMMSWREGGIESFPMVSFVMLQHKAAAGQTHVCGAHWEHVLPRVLALHVHCPSPGASDTVGGYLQD